ncbi:hypothetical protein CEXT_349581 [Caerostris extrusa]|uniref:Uncharacterized protein n=1 Tax=Caerostris extrusa TaxID=172846 RepID=A0AAV4VC18_CAEEX|nr:hypothetical protein CEXT_349581 [Caerostris extrusa]
MVDKVHGIKVKAASDQVLSQFRRIPFTSAIQFLVCAIRRYPEVVPSPPDPPPHAGSPSRSFKTFFEMRPESFYGSQYFKGLSAVLPSK